MFFWVLFLHAPDYAVIVFTVANRTRGTRVFVSRAIYGDPLKPWNLTGTTTWSSSRGKRVEAGDKMRLIAVYDSTRTRRDVMGNLRVSFAR